MVVAFPADVCKLLNISLEELLLQVCQAAQENDVALLNTLNEKITNIANKPNNYTADLEALEKKYEIENVK